MSYRDKETILGILGLSLLVSVLISALLLPRAFLIGVIFFFIPSIIIVVVLGGILFLFTPDQYSKAVVVLIPVIVLGLIIAFKIVSKSTEPKVIATGYVEFEVMSHHHGSQFSEKLRDKYDRFTLKPLRFEGNQDVLKKYYHEGSVDKSPLEEFRLDVIHNFEAYKPLGIFVGAIVKYKVELVKDSTAILHTSATSPTLRR